MIRVPMWDLLQHFQIESVREEAQDAAWAARSQNSRIEAVEAQIERLTLASQAMWELLRDHSGLTEGQLYSKILEIDGRDGSVDGSIPTEVIACPHCGKNTNTNKLRCVYCRKPVKPKHQFKT
jgi:hypothetical protein